MKFIEVRDGFSISIKEIEAVERLSDMGSRIYTKSNAYITDFPYSTLMNFFKDDDREIINHLNVLSKSAQFYAG